MKSKGSTKSTQVNKDKKMKKISSSSSTSSKSLETRAIRQDPSSNYILMDRSVTKNTMNNLALLLSNETTKKLFFEFSEKELSSNHLMFYFAAKEFRDKYVQSVESPESQEQQRDISMPNTQQPQSPSTSSASSCGQDMVIPIVVSTAVAVINGGDSAPSSTTNDTSSPSSSTTPVTQRRQSGDAQDQQDNNNSSSTLVVPTVTRADSFSSGTDQCSNETSPSTINNNNTIVLVKSSDDADKVSRESDTGADVEGVDGNVETAKHIFEQYLSPESEIEVNLDYRTFIDISKRIQSKQVSQKLFDRAIKEIFDVINNDSYHRFKSSPIFKTIIQQCTEFENNPDFDPLTSQQDQQQQQNNKKKSKGLFSCFSS